MRSTVWMLLVAAFVAGCGASASDDAREPEGSAPPVRSGEPGYGTGGGGMAQGIGAASIPGSGQSDQGGGSGDSAEPPPPPPPGPPGPPPPPPEAETAFREGLTHMQQADFQAALASFRRAYELYPRPNILFNVAVCLERLGDRVGAIEAYERFLAEGSAEISAEQRQTAEDKIRALREQTGS